MVNVRFSNFDDFYNFLRQSPKKVQQLLLKAYPDYAKQMYDAYNKVFNNQKQIAQEVQPKLSAAKKTTDTAKNISKTVANNKGVVKGLGNVGKKTLPVLGAVFEVPNLLNKKSSPQSKALSGLAIGSLLTGHPIIGTTALIANSVVKNADKNIYKNSEAAYNKWANQYGAQSQQYDPSFIKLSEDELNAGYGNKADVNNLVNDMNTLGNLEQQVVNEQALTDKAKQSYEAALLNSQNVQVPNNQLSPNNNLISNTPININSNRGIQNAQEGQLNNPVVSEYQKQIQQPLTDNVAPSNQISNNLTSKELRLGAINNLMDLQEMNNMNNQNNYNPQDYMDTLQLYANIAQQQRQIELANREANLRLYNDLINQYQQAVNADRRQQMVNNVSNALGNLTTGYNHPVQYVGFDGGLKTIGYNRPANQPFTGRVNNVEDFRNRLALEQARGKAAALLVDNSQKDLLNAMVAGEYYKTNPAMFLTGYGEKVVDNMNNLQQEDRKTYNELMKLPANLKKDIALEQYKQAGDLELENLKAQHTAEQQEKLQNLKNYVTLLGLNNDIVLQQMRNQGQKELASIYGTNAKDLAKYKKELESLEGMSPEEKALTIFKAMPNFTSPQDAVSSYQMLMDYFGNSNTSNNTPSVSGGQITPAGMSRMLKGLGNR